MLKVVFKKAWDRYLLHIGGLIVSTILMFILYLILLKFTILGGEFIKPFFLYGMFYVILNFTNNNKIPEVIVDPDKDETEYFVKSLRHRPGRIDFSHFLSGFSNKNIAFKLLCYGFLKTLFLAIGLALLVIPGIYFEIATIFALPIIVRKKDIGVIDSFKESIKLFNEYFLELILIIFILIALHAITAFPYGLFSIIVFPFSMCVIASAYEYIEERQVLNVK